MASKNQIIPQSTKQEIETEFQRKFLSNEKDADEHNSLIEYTSFPFHISAFDLEPITFEEIKKIFEIMAEETTIVIDDEDEGEGEKFLKKRKRSKNSKKRNRNDNNLIKSKRSFFNYHLINYLEKLRKEQKIRNNFGKFPSSFMKILEKSKNKKLLNLTLREIFETEELYELCTLSDNEKFWHNYNLVKSEEIKENEEFKKVLNKTFRDLYKEYVNSENFEDEEINRLNKKKTEEEDIESYIKFAKRLIEYLEN